MVDAVPVVPTLDIPKAMTTSVKAARPDVLQFNNEDLPEDLMTNLVFEEIGGQELIGIVRNDIVNGQRVIYNPISNMSDIANQYNSYTLAPVAESIESYFNGFSIRLDGHIPDVDSTSDIDKTKRVAYIDPDTRNLVLNLTGMRPGEQVQVQILSSGSVFNDTIYEVI
jgi:hypothetical protein